MPIFENSKKNARRSIRFDQTIAKKRRNIPKLSSLNPKVKINSISQMPMEIMRENVKLFDAL